MPPPDHHPLHHNHHKHHNHHQRHHLHRVPCTLLEMIVPVIRRTAQSGHVTTLIACTQFSHLTSDQLSGLVDAEPPLVSNTRNQLENVSS